MMKHVKRSGRAPLVEAPSRSVLLRVEKVVQSLDLVRLSDRPTDNINDEPKQNRATSNAPSLPSSQRFL